MPRFSVKSRTALGTAHPLLQRLMNAAIQEYDFSVLWGHRGEEAQNACFDKGFSKLRWPKSKHNSMPSMAVDIAPYPIDWKNIARFEELGAVVFKHWAQIPVEERDGWKLEWGGTWKKFRDYPHFELKK